MNTPATVFFPAGVALAWAGLFHWIVHALGRGGYHAVFHSIAQVQGFMTCFAAGFLFTAIPRRTGTAPPARWQLALGLLAPVATTVAAWYGQFAWSQLPWLALAATLIGFAVARFRAAGASRRPPSSFVWIPFALLLGIAGTIAFALYGALDLDARFHELGRVLVLQGVLLGLVLGVGGMVLPLLTRGDAPPDAPHGWSTRTLAHVAAALVLAATFWIEAQGDRRAGHALRAAVVLAVLVLEPRIHRMPSKPGSHRWLVWASAWAIPAGYAIAAAFPARAQVGLHVVFIAGFALMALAVGLHVTLAHGPRPERASLRPWQVAGIGVCTAVAVAARALAELDGVRRAAWLGVAAAAFLAGTLLWLGLVAPLWRLSRPESSSGIPDASSHSPGTHRSSGS